MTAVVAICGRCREGWPWAPASAPPGAVLVGTTGEVLRVSAEGHLDLLPPGGYPHSGIAGESCVAERDPA